MTQQEIKKKLDGIVAKLTKSEKQWIERFGRESVQRVMMASPEIKQANLLIKKGVMLKGHAHDGYVQYTVESFVWSRI